MKNSSISFSLSNSENNSNSNSDSVEEYSPKSNSRSDIDSIEEYDSESNSISDLNSNFESGSNNMEYDSELEYDSSETQELVISKIIGMNQPMFSESLQPLLFYVKYKDKSYKCCEWISKEEICETKRGTLLYQLFKSKPTPFDKVESFKQIDLTGQDFDLFSPYDLQLDERIITPEKVISMRKKNDENEYLVKWTTLDIEESTWETDVPDELIEEFNQRKQNPHSICFDPRRNKEKRQFETFSESPEFKNGNTLADYQVDGLNWLQMCWFQNKNSILADEMGLGKTIESISILFCLSKWYKFWGPFLVVCPLSTITNWHNEFKKWTNFRVVSLMGSEVSRKFTKENLIFAGKNKKDRQKVIFDVLIVSYEWLQAEINFIKRFRFMYTIIDEAQRIKNATTKIYKHCRQIRSYHFLLMTGTPIQNNLFEIWSLLHFIAPSKFDDFEPFESKYIDKENPDTIQKLQEILRPYIFRRKKNEVNLSLPEKEEIIIEVEMTQIQRTFSQLFYKDNLGILSNGTKSNFNMNNIMLQFRKLYCHPFLFPNLESICLSQYKDTHHIPYSTPLNIDDEINSLILASGKTILIDKLIPKLKEGKHKILIFSQFTSVLDILEDYLSYKKYSYERLDGHSSTSKRSNSIEKFQNDEEVFIFLLSTKAGGLGINLTRADTVIIYDSDWNPQNDIQAQARCHRFGQTRKVTIYRLVTRGSYESEMFLRASKKLALDYAILDSDQTGKKKESKQDKKELEMILKKGAYYTFKDDSSEIDKFCSENIDQILEHRSHTRKDVVSGGNSKFSKVSFEAQLEEDEFWEKLIEDPSTDEKTNKSNNTGMKIRTRPRKKINYSDITQHQKREKSSKGLAMSSPASSSNLNKISSQSLSSSSSSAQLNQQNSISINLGVFTTSINHSIYSEALKILINNGIGSSRFFVNDFVQEIIKSIAVIIYNRFPNNLQKIYSPYINQFIPDFSKQLYKTPFIEFSDPFFFTNLFKGEELKILKSSYAWDNVYKAALFISNEVLPAKFQFAPEIPTFSGWTAIEDFAMITSCILSKDHQDFLEKDNLPFKSMILKNPELRDWIFKRIKLIVPAVSIIMPKNYSVYESINPLIPKKINDIQSFSLLNQHVIHPSVLSINMQKKLLRIFYLYGIPKKNGMNKIREILRNNFIPIELITIFAIKVLIKAIKYQPELSDLLQYILETNKFNISIDDNSSVDIRWIKESAIIAVAFNIDLIYKVRENIVLFNSIVKSKSNEISLKKFDEMKNYFNWTIGHDLVLFNITAYYGFLFNSMLCFYITSTNIDNSTIADWRNQEVFLLTPIKHDKAKYIEPLFNIDIKKNRISYILSVIKALKMPERISH